jgi:hypothetical protein
MADQLNLAALALLPDTVKRKILQSVDASAAHASQQQQQQQQEHHVIDRHAGTAAVADATVNAVRSRAVQLPALGTAGACVVDNVLLSSEAQVLNGSCWPCRICTCQACRTCNIQQMRLQTLSMYLEP